MRNIDLSFPGAREQFDACKEMASEATIEYTYFVTSPRSASDDVLHITRSLSTALELWKNAPRRCLSVAVRWSIGDEAGVESITYPEQNRSKFRPIITESLVRDLSVQNVANRLFRKIPQLEMV